MNRGLFITVEGTDGCGKTTQINLMREYMLIKGYEVVLTREPGGTKIGEKIRKIILDPNNQEMDGMTELLLYSAARAQLVSQVIKPAIQEGKVVICDRFLDSTYAYQGLGRGISQDTIKSFNGEILKGIMPDITFFFDLKPEIALSRRMAASGYDRIEKEEIDFHERVYIGYKELAMQYPDRIKSIDSNRSVDEIAKDTRRWLDRLL